MDAVHVAYQILFINWNYFFLIQGISELFKSYWAATKGEWPGEEK
jgi:hypothetical protein